MSNGAVGQGTESPKRPTELKKYERPLPAMSVYVPENPCVALGGRRSVPLGQAIRCWSQLMVPAALDNERSFSRTDWQVLAWVWSGRERSIDPEMPRPQEVLADGLEQAARIGFPTGAGLPHAVSGINPELVLDLAKDVRRLDYLHAWAILWSLQWRWEKVIPLDSAETWWTLLHRQQNPLPTRRMRNERSDGGGR